MARPQSDKTISTHILEEGLDYAILHYYGPVLPSENKKLCTAWRKAHAELQSILKILNLSEDY